MIFGASVCLTEIRKYLNNKLSIALIGIGVQWDPL